MRSLRFRITAWYAGLLAGTLILFGVSVYLGLERYLDWTLQRTLVAECRTIGTQLLSQRSDKDNAWLATEINEAYAPEVNGRFIRVVRQGAGVIYASASPKDGTFDPSRIPLANDKEKDGSRKLRFGAGNRLLIQSMALTTANGTRFLVESGAPYNQIEVVLHGLLLTLAIYMPFVVSLAVAGGYWLMRRSLAPVDEITKRAEGITSTNLGERLPDIRTGDELERLSASLNRMIGRLDDAFQHINRFSADASHELRTPLTILQLELEGIAQNHRRDPALGDQIGSALEETHRMSRIVESLLAMRDKFLLHLLCQKTTQSKFPTLQANRKRVRVGPKVVRNFRQGSVFNVMLNQGCSCLHGKQGQSTLQQFRTARKHSGGSPEAISSFLPSLTKQSSHST